MEEHLKNLENLRTSHEALTSLHQELDAVHLVFAKWETMRREDLDDAMSRLDSRLTQYGSYEQTIVELAEGLADNLEAYVQFVAENPDYQGFEKVLAFLPFTYKMAERKRSERLQARSPHEPLQSVLEYGEQLFTEICGVCQGVVEIYTRLQADAETMAAKIATDESNESARRERFGTLVYQTRQALDENQQAQNAFEKLIRDLERQATQVEEHIEHVIESYLAAPKAVKVMMTTEGLRAVSAADDLTQRTTTVSDGKLAREEKQLLEEQVITGYLDRMEMTIRNFNEQYDAVRPRFKRAFF